MKKRIGQVSVEYLMITTLLTIILIPTLYLFITYTEDSANQIDSVQLDTFATEITSTAETVLFLGAPSRRVIEQRLPENVKDIRVIEDLEGNSILEFELELGKEDSKIGYPITGKMNGDFYLADLSHGIKSVTIEAYVDDFGDTVAYIGFGEPSRIFVTNGAWDGNDVALTSGGVIDPNVGPDQRCQAEGAILGGEWTAWISGEDQMALEKIRGSKYIRLDGKPIAYGLADLTDGVLANPIMFAPDPTTGSPITPPGLALAWTGTNDNGIASLLPGNSGNRRCGNPGLGDWTRQGGATGYAGDITATGSDWTNINAETCSQDLHLYCIEQAPVPASERPQITDITDINGVSAWHSPDIGGASRIMKGSNFQNLPKEPRIIFIIPGQGQKEALNVELLSSGDIQFITPGGWLGTAHVIIQNPDGALDVEAESFEFLLAPSISSIENLYSTHATSQPYAGLLPAQGKTDGTSSITIHGDNFKGAPDPVPVVHFDEGGDYKTAGGSAVSVISPTELQVQVPARTDQTQEAYVNIIVENWDAQRTDPWPNFLYQPPPTLNAVLESSGGVSLPFGSVDGGESRFLSGQFYRDDFGELPLVHFIKGGIEDAVPVVSFSSTELEIVVPVSPDGLSGVANIRVRNPDRQEVTIPLFTYEGPPAIDTPLSFTPSFGPVSGGNEITIHGTNLRDGATVHFGANTAFAYDETPTSVKVLVPMGVAGPVDVFVTNPAPLFLTSNTITNGYTYANPPTLLSIVPAAADTSGNYPVTLTVQDLKCTPAPIVHWGQSGDAVEQDLIITSGCNEMTGTITLGPTPPSIAVPASPLVSSISVIIENADAQISNAYTFQYTLPAPAITSIHVNGVSMPNSTAPLPGALTYAINGAFFDCGPALQVLWDTTSIPYSACSANQILVNRADFPLPAGVLPDVVNVEIRNQDGQLTAPFQFTYINNPSITSLQDPFGSGGDAVRFIGTNFYADTTVDWGGTLIVPDFIDPSRTFMDIDSIPPGSGTISVTTIGPSPFSLVSDTTFQYWAAPIISTLIPSNGPESGGNDVTIIASSGLQCSPLPYIEWDGNPIPILSGDCGIGWATVRNVPPGSGTANVQLFNADDQGSNQLTYTYNPGPDITSIDSPLVLRNSGYDDLQIIGTNFDCPGVSVSTSPSISYSDLHCVSSTLITLDVPTHGSEQTITITVTNTIDGQSDQDSFDYIDTSPVISAIAPTSGSVNGAYALIQGANFDCTSGMRVYVGTPGVDRVIIPFGALISCTPGLASSIELTMPAWAGPTLEPVMIENQNFETSPWENYQYTVTPPTIVTLSSHIGPQTGGQTLVIQGHDFVNSGGNLQVWFDETDNPAKEATITNFVDNPAPTMDEITVSTPDFAALGISGDTVVYVRNSDSLQDSYSSYTFNPKPVIDPLTPTVVPAGLPMIIYGHNFYDTNTVPVVTFSGSSVVEVVPMSNNNPPTPDELTVNVPGGFSGPYNVVVTNANPDSQASDPYTVTVNSGPSALAAYWNADILANHELTDVSGGNSAALVGFSRADGTEIGTVSQVAGVYGSAIDTTNGVVQIPTTNMHNFGAQRTITFWINPSTSAQNVYVMNDGSFSVQYDNKRIIATIHGGIVMRTEAAIEPNEWTHIAVVKDSGTRRLYINGAEAASDSGSSGNIVEGTFYIGSNSAAGTRFAGKIDEVRMFAQGFSASLVQDDLSHANGRPSTQHSHSYSFEHAGSTVIDTAYVQQWSIGTPGGAVVFGSNQYAQLPIPAPGSVFDVDASDDFTFITHFRVSGGNRPIFTVYDGSSVAFQARVLPSGSGENLEITLDDGSSVTSYTSPSSVTNSINRLGITRDAAGDEIRIFLNGAAPVVVTDNTLDLASTGTVYIGATCPGCDGSMGELTIDETQWYTQNIGDSAVQNLLGSPTSSANVWGTDNDGDTYGSQRATSVSTAQPAGREIASDCNDNTGFSSVYQFLDGYGDIDGDSVVDDREQRVCTGASLPSGYQTSSGSDCDPTDATSWHIAWAQDHATCQKAQVCTGVGYPSEAAVPDYIVFLGDTWNHFPGTDGNFLQHDPTAPFVGVEGADELCNQLAALEGLAGTYTAWLSESASTEPRDRGMSACAANPTSDLGWSLVDGTVIASNYADLTDGTIQNGIQQGPGGDPYIGNAVRTCTTATGEFWSASCSSATQHCSGFSSTSDSQFSWGGNSNSIFIGNGRWSADQFGSAQCDWGLGLYCFQTG